MRRVLVTGGTGFVGANLVRRLREEGHRVHLLVREPAGPHWRLEGAVGDAVESVTLHAGSVTDADAVRRAVAAARPEWVFHLAAYGAYSWETGSRRILETNLLGTAHLVEACLETGFEAFVHTGSSSEYGSRDHAPAETECPEPNSDYAVGKAAATLYCSHAGRKHGAPIVTLRLYTAYGPWEDPGRLMPALVVRGLRGEWPPLVAPETPRDYVYVDDVVRACILAARAAGREPGAVYNVGSGIETTLREVVATARRVLPISAEPAWGSMPNRAWDTGVWVSNPARIRSALGWRPTIDLEQGFWRMVEWYRSNPALAPRYEARILKSG